MEMIKIEVAGQSIALTKRDRVAKKIMETGSFESASLELWSEMVKIGTSVFDVGAYSGLFSIIAAKMGAYPIAIEPMKEMVEVLRDNAYANEVFFDIHEAAADEREGQAEITYNAAVPYTSGASLSYTMNSLKPVQRRVPVITLDRLSERLSSVSAIKIDVEGHEPAVLRGARATIERFKPLLLVESLNDVATHKVAQELPGYRIVKVLDVRNLYMEPV